MKLGKERISFGNVCSKTHNFFYFTITLITWKEKIKLLLIASLVKGALFKKAAEDFEVSTEVWGTQEFWPLTHTLEETGIIQREKESYWGQIALPPTD